MVPVNPEPAQLYPVLLRFFLPSKPGAFYALDLEEGARTAHAHQTVGAVASLLLC